MAATAHGHIIKPYVIMVICIVDITLPAFETGVPYSHQMTATGDPFGAGYVWRIRSGSLPDGLAMDGTGLIYGTPTGLNNGVQPIVFEVDGGSCSVPDRTFFAPHISMSTTSTTTIATVRGFGEFIPSNPPKKYKKLSWTGYSEQYGIVYETISGHAIPTQPCGRARYDYSGTSEINTAGTQISYYSKLFSADCPTTLPSQWPAILIPLAQPHGPFISFGNIPLDFVGYCWAADPNSCASCNDTVKPVGDQAANSIDDLSRFLGGNVVDSTTSTSLIVANARFADVALSQLGVTNFPSTDQYWFVAHWIQLYGSNNYSGLLESEYTDAEALANAVVVAGTSPTAANIPRTTGFVSTFATVNFTFNCTNLLDGENYTVRYYMLDSNGLTTMLSISFTADSTTKTLTGSLPTPAAGHTLTLKKVTIAFT